MLKLLVDMNLSEKLADRLRESGYDCCHWKEIGDAKAPDAELFDWAKRSNMVIITRDIGFGGILTAIQGIHLNEAYMHTGTVRSTSESHPPRRMFFFKVPPPNNVISVVQVRCNDSFSVLLCPIILQALRQSEEQLRRGALVVVTENRMQIRTLPFASR